MEAGTLHVPHMADFLIILIFILVIITIIFLSGSLKIEKKYEDKGKWIYIAPLL